ncbi:MAG: preprotein translocase subunit SecY [Clostridia bacterium]|nr:preprotein translocase subunit SecY [Butyricicoccus sp.]MBQ8275789.1 preprotein translocase subunit SecY [Clostridia bacterium]
MFQTLKNAWKVPELKSKLLFTLVIVILYRIGSVLPVPYVSADVMNSFNEAAAGSIFQYLNILSGDAFARATLFALGVSPYITSSIVIQLLTIAIPALERLAKDGDEGKKKLTALTRLVTVALALITAIGYALFLKNGINGQSMLVDGTNAFHLVVIIACYCAGAALVMWLAEKINENGIGNGISMILFAGIVSRGPALVSSLWYMMFKDGKFSIIGLLLVILSLVITLAVVGFVVFMTHSERRIPIQYAKKVVGRKMYGGQASNLPIKLNMSGVMPIIFANSIVAIPATIAAFFPNSKFWSGVNNFFNYTSPVYAILFFALIIAFAYFYIAISFNPVEVANNLKKNGGSIPGIRPGRPTTEYITRVLNRITLIGAIFLGVIAVFPMIINMVSGGQFAGLAFGGSSLLIVVGVALETTRDLEAQMSLRHYKGFLE